MHKIHIQAPEGNIPPMHMLYAAANWLARDDINIRTNVLIGDADEEYHVEVSGEVLMLMGQAPALYINVKRIPGE